MKLSDLLDYNNIVIQCHDNPDADALASGYALKCYFDTVGKKSRFIYRGRNKIKKSNLVIMIQELNIPISYEPDFDEVPELLVLVDCQYGQRNVTTTEAKNVAVIDHHQICSKLPPLSEVRPNIGSCSTILWSMIEAGEGMETDNNRALSTALYYGLYTDTNKFSEMSHPMDRDMVDDLTINKSIIDFMSNSNFSLEELEITGRAMLNNKYYSTSKTMLVQAEPCDPNILGVISDFTLETDKVDICVAFYESPEEIKYSVRSCSKEVHANELAQYIAKDVGGGGGHLRKAGGTIIPDLIGIPARDLIIGRLEEYHEEFSVLYAKDTIVDTKYMKKYAKQEQVVGTVKLSEVFEIGTEVELRTMEGDIDVIIQDDTYLMIGIEGEIYPITEEKLKRSYNLMPFQYTRKYEYEPNIRNRKTGEKKYVMPYAKSCTAIAKSTILAQPLNQTIKLFTAWDDEKYYTGVPGDYIAVRPDDPHDIYIINKDIFPMLYKEI